MRIIYLISLLLIVVSSAQSPVGAQEKAKKTSGKEVAWVLDQSSSEAGRGQVVISPKAVRIKLKSLTAILVAPKFDAIIFDTSTKKYVELPYKEWTAKYQNSADRNIASTGKKETIAGLKSTCYRVPSRKVVKEVWFTNDIPVSRDMSSFICSTMHLPPAGGSKGLPVRQEIIHQNGAGARERVFDTIKLSRRDKIDPKLFQCPDGFKKVKSEYQLFVKDDAVKDMGGFLQ